MSGDSTSTRIPDVVEKVNEFMFGIEFRIEDV